MMHRCLVTCLRSQTLASVISTRNVASIKVDNILIVGSGSMGTGIAQLCAQNASKFKSIQLQDISQDALNKAKTQISANLTKIKENDASLDVETTVSKIEFTTSMKSTAAENLLIIEAVPEILQLKQDVFKEICATHSENKSVIFATDTSSLSLKAIAKYVGPLDRFAGLHFFSPVPLTKLVEVIRVESGTSDATFDALKKFAEDIGKVSVSCKDTPGFIVNRLLAPYMMESVQLLERGVASAKDIDTAMKLGAGYPMGPFELLDHVGRDTTKFICEGLSPSTRVETSKTVNDPAHKDLFKQINPFKLVEEDLDNLWIDIKKELWTERQELEQIANYYFDGKGKAFRPMIVVLIAKALNYDTCRKPHLMESQKVVAMAAEMIHTASLVHDDVIDTADTRRGKASVNMIWEQKKAIWAGDFILSRAAQMLAKLRNDEVIFVLSQVLLDLVKGEFMQMGSKENESERFSHYIHKSFKKTASLIAHTAKAVAYLAGASEEYQEASFEYGRNLGIAFQLVDDLLDFVSSAAELGKPAAADLRLGLATAPVLFASEKFPELNSMILRRFSEPGDVEKAYDAVMKSDGLDHTRLLAQKHADEALRHISPFADSVEKQALVTIAEMTLNRTK